MNEDQLETWMHNMIRACNRSTYDSDINVIKLIQHIENLLELELEVNIYTSPLSAHLR